MKRTVGTAFVVAGATFFAGSLSSREVRSGTERATRPEPTPEVVAEGKTIYGDYCVTCHGETGKGDGEAAYLLLPSPRDFTEGKFNRRNTPPRSLPSDDDLFRAISEGLLGSAMPPWKDYLTEKQRWALVEYLKKELIAVYDDDAEEMLSLYELDPPGAPLAVPEGPLATLENVAIGRGIYDSIAECWTCHGHAGHGDGPQAADIVNARGERIYPIDLTKGIYKLSSNDEELFRRIRDGITLAPMYSMGEKLTDEEVWYLVHFVRSLVNRSDEERKMNEQYRRTIMAAKVGDLPTRPDDESWKEISASYIPLMPLWWRRDRIEGIFVKAVHNGTDVSIQLSWIDDTEDTSVMRTEDFYDGAAIQFSADERPPFFGMGAKGGVVNIWHWKADWEVDQSIDRKYPNMAYDHYQYRKDSVFGEHGKVLKAAISEHDPMFLTGLGAGNPLSNPERKTSVEDLNAGGVGTLTSQGRNGQGVRGTGKWYKGRWRVVFTRELYSTDDGDIALSSDGSVNVAFAVWNGSQMDRNGQKSVTIWHRLNFEE
jgi:mono/diheme cytochrome c family protein